MAIKVLPSATVSDPDRRRRLEQEARSASGLNHPNILTVYDIGEADGIVYIAMELVEGRTLRELVVSEEPLPTRKLLDFAVQIAEGLAKAHLTHLAHGATHPFYAALRERGHPGLVLFSSGSTGKSKAAVHDLAGILEKFKSRVTCSERSRSCSTTTSVA